MKFVAIIFSKEVESPLLQGYLKEEGIEQVLYLEEEFLSIGSMNYIQNILKDDSLDGLFAFNQKFSQKIDLNFMASQSKYPLSMGVNYSLSGPYINMSKNFQILEGEKSGFDGLVGNGVFFFKRSFFRLEVEGLEALIKKRFLQGVPCNGVDLKEKSEKNLPCLFLDRDGILIEDTAYPHREKDLVLKNDVIPLIKYANKSRCKVIVLTNQAGIGRGLFGYDEYHFFTDLLKKKLKSNGVFVDDWFEAPYHPEKGVGEYKKESLMRKPGPGMLLKALAQHRIDLSRSMMVGDKDSDKLNLLGLKTLILKGRYPIKSTANLIFSLDEALNRFKEIVES